MRNLCTLVVLLILTAVQLSAQNKHTRNQNDFEQTKIENNQLKHSEFKSYKNVEELHSFYKSEDLFSYTKPDTESPSENWDKDGIYKGYKPEDEVLSLRDRTSKHFSNSDGTMSAFLFSGTSIHYYENGIWKDINNNITLNKTQTNKNYKFSNTENIFKSFFPKESGNQGIKVELKEGSIKEWIAPEFCWFDENGAIGNPVKANTSDGSVNYNKITYQSVFPYTDVQFTQSNDGRKMDIIINDKSALSNIPSNATGLAYSETIIIPDSWTIKTIKGKDEFTSKDEIQQISVFDETGFEIFKYELPIVYENKIQTKENQKIPKDKTSLHSTIEENENSLIQAYYKIEQNENSIKIWTITPKEWLINEERNFPIVIDPTANYYPQNASYWTGRILNSGTTKSNTYLRVRGGSNGRGWAKFDISSITDGSTINDVDMTYYKYNDDGTGPYIDVYQLSTDPVPANAATIWTDCADGNQYCNDLYEFSYGSHTTDLGTSAYTDLSNQLTSDWFGIGTLADDTYSYWEYWYGYDNANSIYITVNYTVPSCTTPTTYSVTGGGSYCSGGGGVAVGLSDSQVGVTYQLYRGATPVGGTVSGTGSALNFGNQTIAGTYTVQTTTAGGYCAISMTGSAVVTVLTPPTITVQPTNQTATTSTSATFTVTASGGGLSYQWQEDTGSGWNNISNGGVYSGSTSANLVITNPTMSMTGYQYRCVITNSCGSATSNGNATITVDYCDSYAINSDDQNIDRVQLDGEGTGDIDNSSVNVCATYSDFTSEIADLAISSNYTLTVTYSDCDSWDYDKYLRAYIDWNQDGDFADANETICSTLGIYTGTGTQNINFTVPIGATAGLTRMRVIISEDSPISSCSSYNWGETEDYGIYILGCVQPSSVYASNITSNSATINWTAPLTPPANDYEYYCSTSSTPPAGSGTNNSDTDVDLSSLSAATTYYVWVRSDCGGGDYSNWTTVYQFTTYAAPCNITSLNFTGSSRTPTLDGGYYYFDVCKDETLTLQANATCTNCGSGTNYNWVINAYDGNGETDYGSNPLDYDIDFASGYDALLEVEGDACYISYPLRFRSSDGPIVNSVSASLNGCSGDFRRIIVGTTGSDVEVTDYHGEVSQTLGVGAETFIPDGPSCVSQCYESSVTFTDFAPGTTITSADDIRYLSINMEHTFIGDMQITLEGPGGCGSAMILPDRYTIAQGGLDDETYDWPWTFIGIYCGLSGTFEGYGRLDGGVWYTTMDFDEITVFETEAEAHTAATTYPVDPSCSTPTYDVFVAKVAMGIPNTDDLDNVVDPCDETEWYNDSGTGWDYCWSNNTSYSYAATANSYIYEAGNVDYYDASESSYTFMRVNPSDEAAGTNFYHPYEDFYTELAGCPLNGTWTIKVCDSWASDNGWIFEWSLALDPSLLPVSWNYDVDLDYTDWSAITDADFNFVTGTPLTYDLVPVPGLSTGTYGGTFTVYDEYGCGTDEYLDFDVTGMSPVTGVAAGDYIWAGFAGQDWDDDLNNWFVYDGANYDYALTFPDATKNVHIVDYCSNPNPLVVNAEAFCKDLNIEAGKTLTMSPTVNYKLNISGDWNNEGTFIPGISTVNFNGTGTQDINTTTAGGETFYNLSLNKTSGTVLNAYDDITVTNELDLSSGILDPNSNTVYMTNTSTGSLVSGNTTGNDGYILGSLQRATDGSSTYTFPIGYTGYDAQGFDIKTTGASGSDILGYLEPYSFAPLQTFAYCDLEIDPGTGHHTIGDGNPGYDGIPDQISLNLNSPLQWDITNPGGGITSYDLTVYPSGSQMVSSISSANGLNVYYLMKNGEPGNAGCSVNDQMPWFPENGFIQCPTQNSLSGLNSFSKFNLIGASGAGSTLPVEITYFDAIYNGDFVELNWTTASELNSDFFLIERSEDALSFNPIGKVLSLAPNGNSNYEINYNFYDKDVLSGAYYYRLKQYDLDGSYDYSNIATVIIGDKGVFTIQPNPAKEIVEIGYYCHSDENPVLKIYDDRGRIVYMDKLNCTKGQNLSSIDISNYAPGLYMVILTTSSSTERAKLIKH